MSWPGVALITGAGSGIGRATAVLFAARGCERICIADVNQSGLEETKRLVAAESPSVKILVALTDVTSEDSVNAMVHAAVETFGRVDYACNVAGIAIPGVSTELSAQHWDKQFAVNTRGMWLCQRAELAQMIKQEPLQPCDTHFEARGSIANVASMAGVRAYDYMASYCASKYAVIGFTKADGLAYAKHKIRVNAINPGVIKTPMMAGFPADKHALEDVIKENYMRRQGLPEEVAESLLWMVSGRASFVTATMLNVNGGMIGG